MISGDYFDAGDIAERPLPWAERPLIELASDGRREPYLWRRFAWTMGRREIATVGDISRLTKRQFRDTRNVGRKMFQMAEQVLREHGLCFQPGDEHA